MQMKGGKKRERENNAFGREGRGKERGKGG